MTVNHDNLPLAVDNLISQVASIKAMLEEKQKTKQADNQALNFKTALNYIISKGIPMSKSRMYKMVSSSNSDIPFRKVGERLLFYSNELDSWCKGQITNPKDSKSISSMAVVKSAQKQSSLKCRQ